jgi:hypothetical protein
MKVKAMFSMKIQQQNITHLKSTYITLTPPLSLIKCCTIITDLYWNCMILYYTILRVEALGTSKGWQVPPK